MGEIAEKKLNGVLCESCGEFLMKDDDGEELTEDNIPGYPRWCDKCKGSMV